MLFFLTLIWFLIGHFSLLYLQVNCSFLSLHYFNNINYLYTYKSLVIASNLL